MFDFHIREDYQPCVNCRHECMDVGIRSATALMDRLPWSFLEKVLSPDMTWKQASEHARETGNFVVTWYSEEAPPCAFRYLEGMLNAIVIVAYTRCGMSGEGELLSWFERMKSAVLASGIRATSIAPEMFGQRPDAILDCALCYWVQAAIAYDAMESHICAGSMMQSNFYLGMAAGPKLASEMNSTTGSRRSAHIEPLMMELRRLLEDLAIRLDGRKLRNVPEVLEHIRVPMVEFHDKRIAEIRKIQPKAFDIPDMDGYITRICRPKNERYHIVGPAFEKVCERKRGRAPRSGKLSRKRS